MKDYIMSLLDKSLVESKSYPLLQLKHLVAESEHVLQFESHLAQVLLEVK